jgi:hypothetical protein
MVTLDKQSRLEKLGEATHWLLLIGAIVGVLYVEVVDRFIVKPPHPDYERTFTMLLVVLLALALGIERNTRFKRIDAHFGQMARMVELALPTRLLLEAEVAGEALRLVRAAEHNIRALVYEEAAGKSRTISEEIAKHMEHHPGVKFELVLVADLSRIEDDFWRIHAQRYEAYRTRGVEGRFFRYILDYTKRVGLDVLIVDDNHLGIAFSPLPNYEEQVKNLGFRFWDQPEIATRVRDWFDTVFLKEGQSQGITIKYEEAEATYWQKKGPNFPV